MGKCKDLPLAKDLTKQTVIEVRQDDKIIQVTLFSVIRGHGSKKWCVTFHGLTQTEANLMAPCHVFFKGNEIGGNFSEVKALNNSWQVTLETVIGIPEYWGEAECVS